MNEEELLDALEGLRTEETELIKRLEAIRNREQEILDVLREMEDGKYIEKLLEM